jgi:hypothetical protein
LAKKGRAIGPDDRRIDEVHRKLVAFDLETWHALNLLARDNLMTFQELADEAFRDVLRKHGRPVEFREALKKSAAAAGPAQDRPTRKTATRGRSRA